MTQPDPSSRLQFFTRNVLTSLAIACMGTNASASMLDSVLQSANVAAQLVATQAPTLQLFPVDVLIYERWPQPGSFLIRRWSNPNISETVALSFGGTATRGTDYTASTGTTITFGVGQTEALVVIRPIRDSVAEPTETVVLSLPAHGQSAQMDLRDSITSNHPTPEEGNRFMTQAGFGPDSATVLEARSMGFEAWINNQFMRPKSYLQPYIQQYRAQGNKIDLTVTKLALWDRVMRPLPATGTANLPDPLRHRIAYSLMQIFVVSQSVSALASNSEGVANYYDRMMDGAFGNFKDLLRDVCLHPCMGVYLSHIFNLKADATKRRFPDENFAREVLQLFSVGLWKLNPDGTRVLVNGQPVPTYDNETVSSYARVFTGLSWGGPTRSSFWFAPQSFIHRMHMWDIFHDLAPKKLIDGTWTPQRTLSEIDTGAAGSADVELAIDSLFNHPNVGPFIGKLLIQRLVTSNPSPEYVSRVTARFNNNGSGVRGDMRAVVRQILLDPEARSYEKMLEPTWGKKREPYMTLFNLGKAFNAQPVSGNYVGVNYLYDWMLQEPFQSPSVFNFYLPSYQPSGDMTTRNLTGPEFQIMTAVTGRGLLNLLHRMIYWYLDDASLPTNDQIKLRHEEYDAHARSADRLVHFLSDHVLTQRISPQTSLAIRTAIRKIPVTAPDWQSERVKLALHLLVISPDFQIQR